MLVFLYAASGRVRAGEWRARWRATAEPVGPRRARVLPRNDRARPTTID